MGIRIDSGDLAYLSREARRMLDSAGFPGVKIVASNELDELVIESIRSEGGRVDIYGVGTRLATGAGEGGGARRGGGPGRTDSARAGIRRPRLHQLRAAAGMRCI